MEINEILKNLHVQTLSKMQTDTIKAFSNTVNDIVVLSPTGTGKTLAYLLPLASSISVCRHEVQAIVVLPARELALQSARVLELMKCGVRGYACFGGRMAMDEHREMEKLHPHVVFGTPGRLLDHLRKNNIPYSAVTTVVIDEFDKCLDMGFSDEMQELLQMLTSAKRHILLSATEADAIPTFVNMSKVTMINYCDKTKSVDERIKVQKIHSPSKDKLETLNRYLCFIGDARTIVFANHRESVERIGQYLLSNGIEASLFHGGMEQIQRETELYKFSNGSANVMVCTNLGARGLDIDSVDNVVHYHLPETQDDFIHRSGRTARWTALGNTVFVLAPGEALPSYIERADDLSLPCTLPLPAQPRMCTIYIGKGKKDKISKGDVVGFLCKKGHLSVADIGRIDVKDRYCYVAVSYDKADVLLTTVNKEKIKGMRTVFERIK